MVCRAACSADTGASSRSSSGGMLTLVQWLNAMSRSDYCGQSPRRKAALDSIHPACASQASGRLLLATALETYGARGLLVSCKEPLLHLVSLALGMRKDLS